MGLWRMAVEVGRAVLVPTVEPGSRHTYERLMSIGKYLEFTGPNSIQLNLDITCNLQLPIHVLKVKVGVLCPVQ